MSKYSKQHPVLKHFQVGEGHRTKLVLACKSFRVFTYDRVIKTLRFEQEQVFPAHHFNVLRCCQAGLKRKGHRPPLDTRARQPVAARFRLVTLVREGKPGRTLFRRIILWRIDPLLDNACKKMGGYTKAISGQRLGKHVPVARQQILNIATVGRNNESAVFSMLSVPRCYRQGTRPVDSSVLHGDL
jgi:hypothetical protein